MRVVAVVDLSVPLGSGTSVYPGDPRPRLRVHATVAHDGYNLLHVELGSQSGTHVDAPFHVRDDGARVDELDLRQLSGPAVVVDLTALPRGGVITTAHLGPVLQRLGPGVVVLLHTGWTPAPGPLVLDHPTLDPAACRVLLESGVRTVGIDAPSLDPPDRHLPCHHLLAAVGGVIAENLTALGEVDALVDPLVCLFPIRLEGADGAPVRAVALQLG